MEHKRNLFDKWSAIAIILFIGLCISVLPILYAGFFSHPVADDYSFSYHVHNAFLNGDSILKAVYETVFHNYFTWQGTFSAISIFSLQPGAFSGSFYYLTTFLMIGFLSGSTFFLFETIIRRILKGRLSHTVIISCLTLIMSIQFVPDVEEAFYWFNGSSYYTLFYSFALIFFLLFYV